MKSHHIKFQKILAVLLAILALVGGLFGLCRAVASARAYDIAPLTDERLAELDLTGITHLMIVAHPDDETLWAVLISQTAGIWWCALPTDITPPVPQSFRQSCRLRTM